MKEQLEEIKDNISKCGELVNDNINNDYGFTYGDIVEVLRKAENGLTLFGKTDTEINTSKINIAKFSEAIKDMIEKEVDKKYIQFAEGDCKMLNEILYETYKRMEEAVKDADEYKKIDKSEEE
jgi:ribosomal protein L1